MSSWIVYKQYQILWYGWFVMMERQTLGGEQEENILVQHCINSFGRFDTLL
jgi:hypothetical protein